MIRRLVPGPVLAALLVLPAAASAVQAPAPSAIVKIRVGHLRAGKAPILSTVPVIGSVEPFVPGQRVAITFYLDSHKLLTRTVDVRRAGGDVGRFRASIIVRKDGKYAASAKHVATAALGGDRTVRKSWKVSFPSLHPGECGRVVKGFKGAMAKLGFVSGGGSCFNGRTGRLRAESVPVLAAAAGEQAVYPTGLRGRYVVVSVPMCCTLIWAGGFCWYQGNGGVGRSTPPM